MTHLEERQICGVIEITSDTTTLCGLPRGHAGKHKNVKPAVRLCAWCHEPIRRAARSDTLTCCRSCRQARARFRVDPAAAANGDPMRFGFADPPYPGLSKKYYGRKEVDHQALILQLIREHPDGWALCTSAAALQEILRIAPLGVRVAAWLKGSRPGVAYSARSSWEPVIIWGGRGIKREPTEILDDSLVCHIGGRQTSHPDALVGMKPAAFCEWVFRQLGARQGDELVDLFPGSGAVSRAWKIHTGSVTVARRRTTSRLEAAQRR